MAEDLGGGEVLARALDASARGAWGEAAPLFKELIEGPGLPPEHAGPAARALLEVGPGIDGGLGLAERVLLTVEPGSNNFPEAVRLLPEVLEKKGGRSPKDAADRARAHQRAAMAGEEARRPAHLRGLFRALVRVAELEGTLPALDPALAGAERLRLALEAHRAWRQGAAPLPAATAYRELAGEPGLPAALLPYALYWQGHLEEQAGRFAEARDTFVRLLEVGPPGSTGREDVEGRVATLTARIDEGPAARAAKRARELVAAGQGRQALELLETELHRAGDPEVEKELRRVLVATLAELGELDLAKAQLERLARLDPAGARSLGAGLEARARSQRASRAPPRGAGGEDRMPAAGGEVGSGRGPGSLALVNAAGGPPAVTIEAAERDDSAARHHAELARRLDEAGQIREAVLALRRAWLAAADGPEAERLRKRAAAMAWHKLADAVLAMEALAGLPPASRAAPDSARLEESVKKGVVDRFRREIELGLRTAAFRSLAELYRALPDGEPLRDELLALHLDRLSACLYKRWRLRKEQLLDARKGFEERGMGPWTLVRLPAEAEGSPRHLQALREELQVLDRFGEALEARERGAVEALDREGQARRLEDREGLMAMEALLCFAQELGERRSKAGSENKVDDWRDRLAALLPDGAKALVQSSRGRSMDEATDDLLGQFEAFLDLKYGPRF